MRQVARTQAWATAPLGELFAVLDSQRVPVNSKDRAKRHGNVPYYGATGQVGWIDDYLFDEELVLVGEDGAPFLQSDKPTAYVIRGKSWVNNHAHVLRPLGGTPSLFWKYQLDQVNYRPFVSGTTRLKLSQAPMRRISLVVPPSQEQHRIVEAIESYFSRLEEAVATLERVQRNLERYRASVLKAAVEGRLVPTEAELARAEGRDYEPASVLLERLLTERRRRWEEAELGKRKAKGKAPTNDTWKAKYKEPAAPDTSELPELPEGWCWATVGMLAQVGTGATPKRGEDRYWSNGTVPWVTSAAAGLNMITSPSAMVTQAALEETNLTLYPPGTLVIAMYGEGKTRGRCSELAIEATTNQALAALVTEGGATIVKRWLRLFLEFNYENIRRQASGGVQPNLNLSIVRDILVPLPPAPEQSRIVAAAEATLSVGKKVQTEIAGEASRARRLRQSILKWAFEGKLADQDPDDEPASVLLERIRAERAAAAEAPRRRRGRGRKAGPQKELFET